LSRSWSIPRKMHFVKAKISCPIIITRCDIYKHFVVLLDKISVSSYNVTIIERRVLRPLEKPMNERFTNITKQLGQRTKWPDFVRFWEIILERLGDYLRPDSEDYKAGVQGALRSIIELLESGRIAEAQIDRHRRQILKAALFELKEDELPGRSDDPRTPLGFYKHLSPIPQNEKGFIAYAPCAVSLLEISLQGPGIVLSLAKSLHPELSDSTLQGLKETAQQLTESLKTDQGRPLRQQVIEAVDKLKLSYPFLPLIHPHSFYFEGRRFYGQGEIAHYKCGVTSGFIIPEDYYGQEVYEKFGPGITEEKGLGPGSFVDLSLAENSIWQELLIEAAESADGLQAPINPYRPVYFDSALERIRARGGRFKNLIDIERTGEQFRAYEEKWACRGKAEEYRRDAANILAYFLSQDGVDLYLVRSFDSAWICVYTARGDLGKINHGFWVNPPVIEWLQPSSDYAWELIPCYLLGLDPKQFKGFLKEGRGGRKFWLEKFLHEPIKALFSEENRVKKKDQDPKRLAREIIEELLRPDIHRLTRGKGKEFLTLMELTDIFGRSYGRLRHWIRQFNLGAYSVQVYDHRFRKEDLKVFVEQELRGRKRFPESEIQKFLSRIEQKFNK
jgi:hypothetical protein